MDMGVPTPQHTVTMLRNLFFYTLFIPATALFSLLTVLAPTPGLARAAARAWGRTTTALSGARIHADLASMEPAQPYIIMANHQSQLDIPIFYAILGERPFGIVAKESLTRIWLFGKAMVHAGHIPIDRENRRKAMQAIELATEQARRGVSMVIFPEGTRGTDLSKLQDFKIGGMIMALKTGLPVVPLLISGTGAMLPKGTARLRPGQVRIRALAPIVTQGKYTLKDRETFKNDLYTLMDAEYQRLMREGDHA
jgi:1-acyl-sn-glycerol-3-phosphate acyltransferase